MTEITEITYTSVNEFSVGDLFIHEDGYIVGYIVKISQWKKRARYQYEIARFQSSFPLYVSTESLRRCIENVGWKHFPVSKKETRK